jgi:hypothetical protein
MFGHLACMQRGFACMFGHLACMQRGFAWMFGCIKIANLNAVWPIAKALDVQKQDGIGVKTKTLKR